MLDPAVDESDIACETPKVLAPPTGPRYETIDHGDPPSGGGKRPGDHAADEAGSAGDHHSVRRVARTSQVSETQSSALESGPHRHPARSGNRPSGRCRASTPASHSGRF